jgi:hypothetical protein
MNKDFFKIGAFDPWILKKGNPRLPGFGIRDREVLAK